MASVLERVAPLAVQLPNLCNVPGLTPHQRNLAWRLVGQWIRPGFVVHHSGKSIRGHGNGYARIADPQRWLPLYVADLEADYGYSRMMLMDLAFTLFERGKVEEGDLR